MGCTEQTGKGIECASGEGFRQIYQTSDRSSMNFLQNKNRLNPLACFPMPAYTCS